MENKRGAIKIFLKGGGVLELQGANVEETHNHIVEAQINGTSHMTAKTDVGGINVTISEIAGTEYRKGE